MNFYWTALPGFSRPDDPCIYDIDSICLWHEEPKPTAPRKLPAKIANYVSAYFAAKPPGRPIPPIQEWFPMGVYDGIFFHTYPLNESEYLDQALNSATFAEHFFSAAARLLRAGGVFTYLTNEIDSLSRRHQRALFRHFSDISSSLVKLEVPHDVRDTWWASTMVAVTVTK